MILGLQDLDKVTDATKDFINVMNMNEEQAISFINLIKTITKYNLDTMADCCNRSANGSFIKKG